MRLENYAAGLVEELAGYERHPGMKDRAGEVRAELERIAADLPRALARAEQDFTGGIKLYGHHTPEQITAVMERQPEIQRLRGLETNLTERGYFGARRKRTTKADTPPDNTGGGGD